jgi:hypothetical protein
MKATGLTCALAVALFFALLWQTTVTSAVSELVPIVPIVSEQSRLNDISEDRLRRIFLGHASLDPDGRPLIPLNHPAGAAARERFELLMLGFGPSEAAKYWIDQSIRGAVHPPRSAAPETLLQRVVAKLPGAISYVPAGTLMPGVKALSVDGRKVGDARYPL